MIDCETVRAQALALPEVEEHEHWGRPSFRVRGKIFATLWPDEQRAMLKLPPPEQAALVLRDAATFWMVPGSWGVRGSTFVELRTVDHADFLEALTTAWRGVAPKRLQAAGSSKSVP
ncbi:MAG TPA: MmcQ/YjbR family DNA-binding protein [Roseiflexaceae bacterium]|nr:MmcQ/YjbR family DNA-binding protein [Roseiflexaceae bacterium]